MTDPQMVTIGLATIVLLAGILFNNARVGDVHARLNDIKEMLRAELRAERAETNARFDRLEAKINAGFDRL